MSAAVLRLFSLGIGPHAPRACKFHTQRVPSMTLISFKHIGELAFSPNAEHIVETVFSPIGLLISF